MRRKFRGSRCRDHGLRSQGGAGACTAKLRSGGGTVTPIWSFVSTPVALTNGTEHTGFTLCACTIGAITMSLATSASATGALFAPWAGDWQKSKVANCLRRGAGRSHPLFVLCHCGPMLKDGRCWDGAEGATCAGKAKQVKQAASRRRIGPPTGLYPPGCRESTDLASRDRKDSEG
jgi:hypothetical protein